LTYPDGFWVGKDEHNGLPSLERPDAPKSRWSWEAVAAVERPADPVVSPDGATVAFVVHGECSDVWTVGVDGGFPTRITTDRGPYMSWASSPLAWSPDGSRLAFVQDGAVWVVPGDGGEAKEIHDGDTPSWVDDETLLVTIDRDSKTRLALLPLDDPWPKAVSPEGWEVYGSRPVPGGALFVRFPDDDLNASQIWRVELPDGTPEQLTGVAGMHDFDPEPSPDGKTIVFSSERDGWYGLRALDLATGSERALTNVEADLTGARWHQSGDRLVAIRFRRGRSDLVVVDYPSGEISIVSEGGEWAYPSWAGDDIVAVHEDHRTPPRMVRVGADGTLHQLTGPPPSQTSKTPHASFQEVTYPSFDGLEIHGFLFEPQHAEGRTAPAVVYPHGGPTAAYTDSWDGVAQYFVDKGYAWLAINFRGSTGYGRDFERANHGVWGVADTEDCLAAADYLAGLSWVDPERIAIFGASYGSYMALASLARDPRHRFAGGVLKYGDSDIATSWAQGNRSGREDLERQMRTPATARQAYRDGSPLWLAENIEVPMLIAHGEQDEIVHPDQSAQLVEELKRLGKRFEYVTYPTEAHGLLRVGPFVHFHRRLERFLDWHLM
jgi:dipeptidyl aminopeptidase/acylaminoacyl peptidase